MREGMASVGGQGGDTKKEMWLSMRMIVAEEDSEAGKGRAGKGGRVEGCILERRIRG